MTSNTKEYHKSASRKHYLANKEVIKAKSAAKRKELREFVTNLKNSTPCADCGSTYPYFVMDFDHLPEFEKINEIAHIVNYCSMRKLLEEIAKCELVCSNCHRIRTYTRAASLIE